MTEALTGPENVQLLCLDVDGVLTDGSILIDHQGMELKRFFVRDGIGLRAWMKLGQQVAIITGRKGPALEQRMAELGIDTIYSGVSDKCEAFSDLLEKTGVDAGEVAMVGDDLPDLPILRRCGYAVAVNDGVPEVRDVARFVTQADGGRGAVREVIEHLLRAKGRWEEAVAIYDIKSEAR